MLSYKTQIGRQYTVPSKTQNDYVYDDEQKKYVPKPVETIDFTAYSLIEGDGCADYRSNGLLDLLRMQKMLISDMIMHVSLFRSDKLRELGKKKEDIASARGEELKRLYSDGWEHNVRGKKVVQTSATSVEKLADASPDINAMKDSMYDIQSTIDKLTARKEQLEREYFNCDDSIKTLCKIMGVSF